MTNFSYDFKIARCEKNRQVIVYVVGLFLYTVDTFDLPMNIKLKIFIPGLTNKIIVKRIMIPSSSSIKYCNGKECYSLLVFLSTNIFVTGWILFTNRSTVFIKTI